MDIEKHTNEVHKALENNNKEKLLELVEEYNLEDHKLRKEEIKEHKGD